MNDSYCYHMPMQPSSEPTMGEANRPARPHPRQKRSATTVGTILDVAAALLDEVGFDRLTTNLICERAALTPPALYRHFANKYAVMAELGRRLMAAQNTALYAMLADATDILLPAASLAALIKGQYDVTCALPGGRWIMRSIHSTPALAHVRLESHQAVAESLLRRHLAAFPNQGGTDLARRYRMAVDTGYAMVELMLDRPDLDADAIAADAGLMINRLLRQETRS